MERPVQPKILRGRCSMEGLAPGGSRVDRTGPWFARAARAYTGLSQVMRVPAPADALRVARALLNISQRLAAERAQVMQKSGSAAENSKNVLSETSLALVESYRRQVIEFLGDCANGDLVRRSGAQWSGPKGPASIQKVDAVFHAETTDVLFRAARALLDKGQAEIAVLAKLGLDVVKDLERGTEPRRPYAVLREWYEEQGVKFTGWGDIASRRFYGVGVRWRS